MDNLIKQQQIFNYRYWEALGNEEFQVRGLGSEELMSPGMVRRQQGTPDWLFMLFTAGTRVKLNNKWLEVQQDTLCIFPPGTEHYYGNPKGVWHHSWMHVCGRMTDELLKKYSHLQNVPLEFKHRAFLRHLDYIAGEFRLRQKNSWFVCRNTLEHLLMELAESRGETEHIPERMIKVLEYMESNFFRPITLKDLARRAAISVPLLSLEFKRCFKISPIACVQEIRLRHSLYYLSNLNFSIEEVAKRCGFNDPFYFSRQFRRKYGHSPREFRNTKK